MKKLITDNLRKHLIEVREALKIYVKDEKDLTIKEQIEIAAMIEEITAIAYYLCRYIFRDTATTSYYGEDRVILRS